MRTGELIVERFEVGQSVGSGGMGQVFQARDRASGAVVLGALDLAVRELDLAEREAEGLVNVGVAQSLRICEGRGLRRGFLEDVPEHARTLELARRWLGD